MDTAFQADAFQSDAFQIAASTPGSSEGGSRLRRLMAGLEFVGRSRAQPPKPVTREPSPDDLLWWD